MEAKILTRPPLSGDFEEHNFSTSGNTVWVKFFDEKYLEWVGVFSQSGWSSYNVVLRVPNETLFLVVAGGQGYFVDPNSRKIVSVTEWDNIIYNEESGFLVVSDGLRIALFQGPKLHWSGDRVSVDGIEFTGQSGPVVKGILNDLTDDGCEFSFNASTCEFKAEWIFSEHWS